MRRIVQRLHDAVRGGGRGRHHHSNRVVDVGFNNLCEIGRQRGGEQQRLSFLRQCSKNLLNLWCKSHVQHSVGLIEHQDLYGEQIDGSVPHVIEQASRRRDKNVWSLAETPYLGLHVCPSHKDGRKNPATATQCFDRTEYLDRKLSGRSQNQDLRLGFRKLGQPLNDRNDKCGGFSRSRLGTADHVAPSQGQRNRLCLYRSGRREPCHGKILDQSFGHTKVAKINLERRIHYKSFQCDRMMTKSENRGEKQPGRVPLQTGPGRDAIAKSVLCWMFPAGLIRGNS